MTLQDILDDLDREILPEPTLEEEQEDADGEPTITIIAYESENA